MGKQPYIPLYIGDYIKDTRMLPLNVRGAWADLILFMWDSPVRGEISGTYEDFSRLMGCSIEEASFALDLLMQKKVCDYVLLDNKEIKIISRKMKRDHEISQKRSIVGKLGVEVKFAKAKARANAKQNTEYENEYDNDSNIIKEKSFFEKARVLYPGTKRGLETEFENFKKKHKDWKQVALDLEGKIKEQINSRLLKTVNKEFVPEWKNFSTWINQRCWEEESRTLADKPENKPVQLQPGNFFKTNK